MSDSQQSKPTVIIDNYSWLIVETHTRIIHARTITYVFCTIPDVQVTPRSHRISLVFVVFLFSKTINYIIVPSVKSLVYVSFCFLASRGQVCTRVDKQMMGV